MVLSLYSVNVHILKALDLHYFCMLLLLGSCVPAKTEVAAKLVGYCIIKSLQGVCNSSSKASNKTTSDLYIKPTYYF